MAGTDDQPKFNGSNWQTLNQVVALAQFHFLQDDDYDDNEERKCAYVASRYEGPALDWVTSCYTTSPIVFAQFEESRSSPGV
jgi:hypothetical protein